VHYIEVHYDSDEEDVYEDVALDASLEHSQDSCASDGQWESQDDSAFALFSQSYIVEDSTLHHSSDAYEDPVGVAPRHEDQRLGDPSLDVDMRSCVGDNDPPMELSVTHSLYSQLPLFMTHDDISGILDMVEEPCVVIEHKGHVDLQGQEERHDLEPDDYIHIYQYGESDSPLLESPLIDQVGETERLMGHLPLGPVYSDEDAFLVGRDDHITCVDTSVWDLSVDDISRVNAQEDTTTHTWYMAIQIEATLHEDVQWHTRGFSGTVDSGQYGALAFEEFVDDDSTIDLSSGSHEVAPQQDSAQESRHLAGQLRIRKDMIMEAIKHIDDTHALVAEYCWRATMARDSSNGELVIDDFQTLKERVTVMRTNYHRLLMDRDYLMEVGEMYHGALKEKEIEVDRITHELVSTRGCLEGAQIALQESKSRLEELLEEVIQGPTTSISAKSGIYFNYTSRGCW
jgi:hypothetical protein